MFMEIKEDLKDRWIAFGLDGAFLFGVVIVLLSSTAILAKIFGVIDAPFFRQGWIAVTIVSFYILLILLYFVIMPVKYGQTLGKMALGLKVVSYDGQELTYLSSSIRLIGYCINNLTIIGWLWMFFNEENRGFHDIIANTKVIKCEANPEIKNKIIKLFLLGLFLAFAAMFVTGGIAIEHHHNPR